jgi:hypothetical protein
MYDTINLFDIFSSVVICYRCALEQISHLTYPSAPLVVKWC